jgi:O-antigen/teichoic acid export membrane protein
MGFFVVITALASIFQAMHRPRVPAIMLMLSIIVDLTALIFLVPRYGILGAATSTTIACIIGLLGLAGIYFKLGYIKLDYINAVRTFMSFILFGTLVLIFPHETKILTLFDLVLSSVLYMVVLFVFGLLKDEDIQMILSGFNFSDKKLIERITAHVKSLNLLFRG